MKKHLNTVFVTTQGAYLSKEGETVVVKIISIDPSTRKIGLSLKQYKEELEKKDIAEYGQEAGSVSLGDVAGEELASRALDVNAENAGQPEGAVEPGPTRDAESSEEAESLPNDTANGE